MTEQCMVAVIGAGYMGREHIRAFKDVPGVTVAGIYDLMRERAEALAAEFGVPGVYDSVPELYERTQANLVVVAVSETAMNSVSQACFEFPWTALLEKPAGINVPEAEEIQAGAKAKNRDVRVALNRRFYASTRTALADLAQRPGLRFIKVQDQEDQAQARANGMPEIVIQNWMYANAIHVIDYLRLFGRGQITAIKPIIPWTPDAPWLVVTELEFDSGDVGMYEGIWNGPGPWAVSVSTTEKRWEMRPLEQAAFQLAGQRRLEPVAPHPWDQAFKPGLRLQAEMAVAAALGKPSESPTLEQALEVMHLIKAIFEP